MRGQERRVPALEPAPDGEVIEVDEVAVEQGDGGGGKGVGPPPLGRDHSGRDRPPIPEEAREVPERLGAGPEVGEHLTKTGELLVGAVERPVFAA